MRKVFSSGSQHRHLGYAYSLHQHQTKLTLDTINTQTTQYMNQGKRFSQPRMVIIRVLFQTYPYHINLMRKTNFGIGDDRRE